MEEVEVPNEEAQPSVEDRLPPAEECKHPLANQLNLLVPRCTITMPKQTTNYRLKKDKRLSLYKRILVDGKCLNMRIRGYYVYIEGC